MDYLEPKRSPGYADRREGTVEMSARHGYEICTVRSETPPYRLSAPDGTLVEPVTDYLRELTASDYSPASVKSYAYALLDWFRFLHTADVAWCDAGRAEVRDYVLHLRTAENPFRHRTTVDAPAPGTVNARTGKPSLATGYKAATINHRLSIIKSFYDYHRGRATGPARNPVPTRAPGDRPNVHRTPDDPWVPVRRAPYRQKEPARPPRAISEPLWNEVFHALGHDRDRAIFCLLISSACRAGELLQMTPQDVDWGGQAVRLITKGTHAAQWVAASPDFFRWLARYLAERGEIAPAAPLWQTVRAPSRPLNYQALRKILVRINAILGTNLVLHDFRHTCAMRLASDPAVPLIDVQAHLRHKHLSTTELYLRTRPEEVIARVQAHHRANDAPAPPPDTAAAAGAWHYDPADLAVLLGDTQGA
jgi:integrase/recombinase XerD